MAKRALRLVSRETKAGLWVVNHQTACIDYVIRINIDDPSPRIDTRTAPLPTTVITRSSNGLLVYAKWIKLFVAADQVLELLHRVGMRLWCPACQIINRDCLAGIRCR